MLRCIFSPMRSTSNVKLMFNIQIEVFEENSICTLPHL